MQRLQFLLLLRCQGRRQHPDVSVLQCAWPLTGRGHASLQVIKLVDDLESSFIWDPNVGWVYSPSPRKLPDFSGIESETNRIIGELLRTKQRSKENWKMWQRRSKASWGNRLFNWVYGAC
jgi:hypothetical protein